MKKHKSLRERRADWFRTMFADCFKEWHEVEEKPKRRGLFDYTYILGLSFLPKLPRAKHPDYKALEMRLKTVEQKVCDHLWAAPLKGCLESIFCSKCGALSPIWEKALPKPYDDEDLKDWIEPEVYADGTGYVRKAKTRKR